MPSEYHAGSAPPRSAGAMMHPEPARRLPALRVDGPSLTRHHARVSAPARRIVTFSRDPHSGARGGRQDPSRACSAARPRAQLPVEAGTARLSVQSYGMLFLCRAEGRSGYVVSRDGSAELKGGELCSPAGGSQEPLDLAPAAWARAKRASSEGVIACHGLCRHPTPWLTGPTTSRR